MTRRIVIVLLVLALGAAVIGGITWGYETWRGQVLGEGDARGAARVQALWDDDRAQAQAQLVEDQRVAAAETLRRLQKQKENDDAQQALLAQVTRDRDAARAAGERLQLRASAYLDAAGCGALTGDPALECVRTAAAALGDALGRSAEIARRAAADADEARARGLRCEADYDALILKSS